jgi:hypothetical protein
MNNKERFWRGEYEAKAFWFSEFDSHAGGDDRAAIDTIAPAAQGQVELPTREFNLREKLKDKKFTDGRKQPSNRFCRRRCAQQLRYYELRSINRTIACRRIARSPGERYCRVCKRPTRFDD